MHELFKANIPTGKIACQLRISDRSVRYIVRKERWNLPPPDHDSHVCEACGGPLPCIPCAVKFRKDSQRVGKEPDETANLQLELYGPHRKRLRRIKRLIARGRVTNTLRKTYLVYPVTADAVTTSC